MKKIPMCLVNKYLPTLFFLFLAQPMQTVGAETSCRRGSLGGGQTGPGCPRLVLWTVSNKVYLLPDTVSFVH